MFELKRITYIAVRVRYILVKLDFDNFKNTPARDNSVVIYQLN